MVPHQPHSLQHSPVGQERNAPVFPHCLKAVGDSVGDADVVSALDVLAVTVREADFVDVADAAATERDAAMDADKLPDTDVDAVILGDAPDDNDALDDTATEVDAVRVDDVEIEAVLDTLTPAQVP